MHCRSALPACQHTPPPDLCLSHFGGRLVYRLTPTAAQPVKFTRLMLQASTSPWSRGWQGRGGSPTRALRPANPGEISDPRPASALACCWRPCAVQHGGRMLWRRAAAATSTMGVWVLAPRLVTTTARAPLRDALMRRANEGSVAQGEERRG